MSLREYLGALRRRRRLIVLTTVSALLLAVLAMLVQTPMYRASAEIAVQPPSERSDIERIVFGIADLGTQERLVTSEAVVRPVLAKQGLASDGAAVERFVSSRVKVNTIPATFVLKISVADARAYRAAALAQALATQYLAFLAEDAKARVARSNARLDVVARTTRAELASVQNQLAGDAGSTRSSLELLRDDLQAQLRDIASRRAELESAAGLAQRGEVIKPAVVPSAPATPRWLLGVVVSVILGGAAGVALALLREQSDSRVRDESAVERAGATPLLARVPRRRTSQPEPRVSVDPSGPVADAYRRLRAFLVAKRPPSAAAGHVTVVLPLGREGDAGPVSTNLSLALAESGRDVLLVDADLHRATATQLLGLADQGLVEVLTGQTATWRELVQQQATGVGVLTVGSPAVDSPELLAGRRFVDLLREARGSVEDVVVSAPALDRGAGALDAARLADAVVIVAHTRRDSEEMLRLAVQQLRGVGAVVAGTVLTSDSPHAPAARITRGVAADVDGVRSGATRPPAIG